MIDNINGALDVPALIGSAYKKLTGGPIKAHAIGPNGSYNGSLLDQLNKSNEIRRYIPNTRFTGDALYAVTYEADKPVKAQFLSGESRMASLSASLENHRFQVLLPTGSKARVMRQAKLVCSPYGGCDAYLMLPTHIETPMRKIVAMPMTSGVTPPKIIKSTRTINIPAPPQ